MAKDILDLLDELEPSVRRAFEDAMRSAFMKGALEMILLLMWLAEQEKRR